MLHNWRYRFPLTFLPSLMSLPAIVGHLQARARLGEALRSGRLPQVLAISGPAGVGKQRLALWLGQLGPLRAAGAGALRALPRLSAGGGADSRRSPLVRPDPPAQGGGSGQGGGRGCSGARRGDGGAAREAAVRAARRHGQPLDGLGSAAAPPGGADRGGRRPAGLHPGRRRAAGPTGVESGGGQRAPQAAGGASGRSAVHPDRRWTRAVCSRPSGRARCR